MLLSNYHNKKEKSETGDRSFFQKLWWNINLLVGNSRRFNCKTPEYRKTITIGIMTVYTFMFTLGLFIGDLSVTQTAAVENMFGLLSTAIVYSLGFSILYENWKEKHVNLASVVTIAVIGSQTAFVFNLFPAVITNIFYYFASIITMLFTYTLVHKNKIANLAPTIKDPKTDKQDGFIKV